LAVLQIDLRGFSEINEAHGHAFGDQVLIEIAARIRAAVPAGLTIARLHADGFAVIVQERPAALASAIRERIEAPIDLGDVALRMQARVGIAIYPDDAAGADALLRNAEISLNRAKRSDLPIQFYDQIMGKRLVRKLELANRLELALENDLLELAFQPQVELDSKRLIGAEALLRWNDEVEGWISPDEFLPIAEKRGMMTAIGQWVLTAACRQLAAWDAGGTPLSGHLAVNVSPTQFDDPAFVDSVKRTLADNRVSAERVELEITENAVARDARRATEVMKSLNALGLALAIDDFGVGYSSLAALRYFPVHTLKIDGSFVQRMQESEGDRSIVQTIIAMAKSLELTPLAEGVETAAQAAALHAMGCDRGQGFYFARPLSAEEFREAWLTREPRRAS
jgi:diguanylate cyclase (GGDEF)-like protein